MSTKTIYRNAAALAAIQLDRPFTAQDIARIEACIAQAQIASEPSMPSWYEKITLLGTITPTLSTEVFKPVSQTQAVEEALDEAGKRIVSAFAPRMPRVDDTPPV